MQAELQPCPAKLANPFSHPQPRPTWLYAPAVPCGELLEDSLAPPPGAVAMAVLPANVTRTYTCPDVQAYTATVDFFAPGGELAGWLMGGHR